eukprot:TRINITY_DN8409_c0_g1_i1.p1 TRINITY_DN8409_c0_g1~~TRINITY_DN8409_c0_g1_i1.p1  ORF type:complete len:325 (+),score=68.22 TRINITY_DN8409_c0_g1_i1:238-1212(+)
MNHPELRKGISAVSSQPQAQHAAAMNYSGPDMSSQHLTGTSHIPQNNVNLHAKQAYAPPQPNQLSSHPQQTAVTPAAPAQHNGPSQHVPLHNGPAPQQSVATSQAPQQQRATGAPQSGPQSPPGPAPSRAQNAQAMLDNSKSSVYHHITFTNGMITSHNMSTAAAPSRSSSDAPLRGNVGNKQNVKVINNSPHPVATAAVVNAPTSTNGASNATVIYIQNNSATSQLQKLNSSIAAAPSPGVVSASQPSTSTATGLANSLQTVSQPPNNLQGSESVQTTSAPFSAQTYPQVEAKNVSTDLRSPPLSTSAVLTQMPLQSEHVQKQ